MPTGGVIFRQIETLLTAAYDEFVGFDGQPLKSLESHTSFECWLYRVIEITFYRFIGQINFEISAKSATVVFGWGQSQP